MNCSDHCSIIAPNGTSGGSDLKRGSAGLIVSAKAAAVGAVFGHRRRDKGDYG